MSIIDTAISTVTGALGGIWGYVAAAGLALAIGAYGGYRWEYGTYQARVASDAAAVLQAVKEAKASDDAQAKVALSSALAEAAAQQKIEVQTVTITKEVPVYVTKKQDTIVCIPVGLARVLRAAAERVDPSALQLAPGQSDDACSDVTASEVAGWFTPYADASTKNAEQLNALEAWVVANHNAQVSP